MKLIDNAGSIWHRLWSLRFSILAAVFAGIEVGLQVYMPEKPTPLFAALSGLAAIAAGVSRVVLQESLRGKDQERPQ